MGFVSEGLGVAAVECKQSCWHTFTFQFAFDVTCLYNDFRTCDGMSCKQTASPTSSPFDSPTPSPTANPPATPTESPTSICTITQEYSDGTGGNWELISSIGTDPSEVTTLENLDEFVIPADQVVNVVGTLVVYAKTIIIEGTLDGSGGGYAGAPASYTENGEYAPDGEEPACDIDEIGECKSDSAIDGNGKGGLDSSESA